VKPYRFHAEALAEYSEATRWYDERAAVAPDFVTSVESAIYKIRALPLA
jgi:hypothetical protein